MHKTIKEIETILRAGNNPVQALLFLGRGPDKRMRPNEFAKEIGLEIPTIMLEYYEWMMSVDLGITKELHEEFFGKSKDIKYPYNRDHDVYFDCSFRTESLSGILKNSNIWQEILEKQPHREWKSGFMELCSWDSAYTMVIDTRGEVSGKGCILYWDYKGGSDYRIRYDNFENYLTTKIELLKRGLYFPAIIKEADGNEDFFYGKTRKLIEKTIENFNTTFSVDFHARLPFIPRNLKRLSNHEKMLNKRVVINEGVFKTFQGMVTAINGDKLSVDIEIFGRITHAIIENKDVEFL